jgi:hypothetical protein
MARDVVPVRLDRRPVGSVFGANGCFYFLLEDPRDPKPRGPYPSEADAITACANQAYSMTIADQWELMVDT